MFDVCTTGDTAHIDTIFKFLPTTGNMLTRVWQEHFTEYSHSWALQASCLQLPTGFNQNYELNHTSVFNLFSI